MFEQTLDQQLNAAAKKGDLAAVQALVEKGANINGGSQDPPLFQAAYYGHTAIVQWLVDHGADINSRNSVNSTALMGAAKQGHREAVKILLLAGADRSLTNNPGRTARRYAAEHHHTDIVELIDNPERLQKPSADEVTISWRVNDRTLQEVFNFEKKERITLIRKGNDGPVEAVTRDSFSEIADDTTLRAAFETYRKQGGKRGEDEIFTASLGKARLTPKGNAA